MTPRARIELSDSEARERIHNSLAESMLVEASAGTGKTTELVARIVRVIETGAGRIENIVAVTFTHKAAGELKIRLRQELDRARQKAAAGPERSHLEDALARLEEASIGTIHAFCAQILRERPVEAVVDPNFEELTENQASAIFANAFRFWFQEKLNHTSPALRRALARIAASESRNSGSAIEQLQRVGWELIAWRDFPTHWRREKFDREEIIDALVARVQSLAELAARARKPNDTLARNLVGEAGSLRPLLSRSPWDYDTLEALLIQMLKHLKDHSQKGSGFFAEGVTREQVVNERDAIMHSLELFRQCSSADLAAGLRLEMWDLVERYDALKRRNGKLDYVDLLILARDLVRDSEEVRAYFQNRFSHIFVDEFQDTDPLQAELLLLLAADNPRETAWLAATPKAGKLFLVGDPKQSIYKFRRADVVLYQQIKQSLEERGVGVVRLTHSHRALLPIQHCVNAAFEAEMIEDTASGQTAYSPLDGGAEAIPGQPSIVALPAPSPYGKSGRVTKTAVEACQPCAVGAFVRWLLKESGWKVRGDSGFVPIMPRHVCLLFRRFTNWGKDVTREYIKELEAREIPHLLVGSKAFHAREEVEAIRTALAAIEWPDDELSVYATLRGYLFAIPDSDLLRYVGQVGNLRRTGNPPPELPRICSALDFLAQLHGERNRCPIVSTVTALLEHTRAHAGFVLRPGGHQILANVNRIGDLARAYEAEGGISFRGFVEGLEAEAIRSESSEAPVLEEGAEGVRLMTVHAAKGLEFPVVILADMTAKLAPGEPDRHIDASERRCSMRLLGCTPWELIEHKDQEERRERAEGLRVAYVAATRARDLLVVPVVGDDEIDGWVAPLNKAVYPMPARSRNSHPAPGCPKFGDSSASGWELFAPQDTSIRPGFHTPKSGPHEVVWWDPQTLRLAVEVDVGLTQQDLLADTGSTESTESYQAWRHSRAQAIQSGERKQFDIFTPSEASDSPPEAPIELTIYEIERPADRPSGPRFGTLVHTIMRDIAFHADRDAIERLARSHGRLLGATADEVSAACDGVGLALSHPLVRRAAAASRCHRELPVLFRTSDDRVLEGVIDLAFVESGRWNILDFKTDADLTSKREHYRRQLHWYVHALGRLTNSQPTAHLISL